MAKGENGAEDEIDLVSQLDELAASLQLDAPPEPPAAPAIAVADGEDVPTPGPENQQEEEPEPVELDDDDVEVEEISDIAPPLYLELDGVVTEVDAQRFVIGRVAKMCDLAILDVNVSRQHCAIERREDGYYVVDLGSINGVEIDGEKVSEKQIDEGAEIVLSGHKIRASFFAPMPAKKLQPPPTPAAEEVDAAFVTAEYEAVAVEAEDDPEPLPPTLERRPLPSFEQRVELRLEQLSQEVARLQQSMQAMLTQNEKLKGLVVLSDMLQRKMAARQKKDA